MDLSVVILNFNTKKLLRDCLDSIFRTTVGVKYEVVVVDNASEDGSVQMVKEEFPQVKLVLNKENLGFAKGNNQGIRYASGRYLLFLNSDTMVKKGAFDNLVEFMDKHPEAGAVGPKLLNRDGTPQGSAGKFPGLLVVMTMLFQEHFGGNKLVRASYDKVLEVDWIMGAALMIKREILDKVGGLDEKIFMYYDEVEWCYRIKQAGFKVYFCPHAEIVHLWQKSSQTGREGPILANYKGLIYFYQKHKSKLELFILRIMLRLKAAIALTIGYLRNNSYLKETYGKALKLV